MNTKDPSATKTIEAGSWFETTYDEHGKKNEICSSTSALSVIISFNADRLQACNDAYIRWIDMYRMKHDNSTSKKRRRKERQRQRKESGIYSPSHSSSDMEISLSSTPKRFSIDVSRMHGSREDKQQKHSRSQSLLYDESGTVTPSTVAPSDSESLTDDMSEIYSKGITIVNSYAASDFDTKEALKKISNKQINVSQLITHKYNLEDCQQAFVHAKTGDNAMKIIISN